MRFHILLFLSLVLAFASCEKDSTTEVVTFTQTTLSGETVNANFFGQLTNDQGIVVADAEVRIGNKQTTTDQEGLWSIDNATVVKDQAFLQFASISHHKGSRTLFVDQGNTYEVDVEMLAFTGNSNIDAATGGQVPAVGGNATVTFPAGAFATSDGTPYTGSVRVEAAYLDPNELSTADRMPGDLRATTTDGNSRLLLTYGMVSVELFGTNDEPLQLADGQTATISLPVAGEAANTAPATIPLWYFDDATAQWKEEGSATLENGNYVGEVSHFTFWNCDIPTEYVRLCGTVVFESLDSTTSANLRLVIESLIWGTGYGYTDENGQFCGIIPANETLTLTIYDDCNEALYTVTVGPYASDTDLGTIIVPLAQNFLTNVSGSANCNGVPLTSGAVRISQNGRIVAVTNVQPDGSFTTDFVSCDTSEITVRVVNYATLELGEETFAYSTNIVTGDIGACTQVLTNFFNLKFDNFTYIGDSCSFYADVGEHSLEGSYIGADNRFATFNFFLFDPTLPQPLVPGSYTTPTTQGNQDASLNMLGFPDVPNGFYSMSGLPFTITAVATTGSPYTTGVIGPGTVTMTDSSGTTIDHTIEIQFSAYSN
ncbi:MAG: hypothetical protein AB8F78_03160 [Saprospiraceae bacterium]